MASNNLAELVAAAIGAAADDYYYYLYNVIKVLLTH